MRDVRSSLTLRGRLAIAFVAVAIGAVAALAVVMLLATRSETGRASEQQRQRTAAQVADQLAGAYRAAGGWQGADIDPGAELAARAGAVLVVRDSDGALVFSPQRGPGPQRGQGAHWVTQAVEAGGRRIGTAELRFRSSLTASETAIRDNLVRAALIGSAIAAAIALLGAAVVSRRLARPLQRLSQAARGLESGDLDARVDGGGAPGELGELSRAFDRMADTLARQERSRRRLAGELGHELRTPVTILRGNLEELLETGEEPTADRLASLHEEVLRLGSLVEQLDSLAHAEAPVATLDRTDVDLAALARAQLETLAPQLEAKRLTVGHTLDPVTVRVDRARIGQVIANLLANALKFTPEGGHIEVTVTAGEDEARIDVADTGPGIPEDERARVFERFWRGRAGAAVGGRGVGLAVVADIVHAHGGRVEVHGDGPDRGARFTVALPFAP